MNWKKTTLAIAITGLLLPAGACKAQAHADEQPRTPAPAAAATDDQKRSVELQVQAAQERAVAAEHRARARAAVLADKDMVRSLTLALPSQKMEKGTYLGVSTSRVGGALREHLKLQKGVGLVVETVEKDSPAASAGLQQFDILQKLNDQWLINNEQMAVLVRMFKAGDDVTLTALRQGQTVTVTAKLVERDVPVMGNGLFWSGSAVAPAMVEGFEYDVTPMAGALAITGDANLKEHLLKIDGQMAQGVCVYTDSQNTLEITEKDGVKNLKATDNDGKVIFEGPINTEEQKKALPPEIAEKLKKFEQRIGSVQSTGGQNVNIRVIER